jgi:Xaa-Pro aminopeptidase
MRTVSPTSGLFAKNRARLRSLLPADSFAVVCSNPLVPRSGDQFYPYRQHPDFYYLTGIGQEGSTLILTPETEELFIRQPDPKTMLWSGPLLTLREARGLSGIREVKWSEDFDGCMEREFSRRSILYLNHDPSSGEAVLNTCDARMWERAETSFPLAERISLGPFMKKLRMIKEPEEIEEIRMACVATGQAFFGALEILRPGVMEFELEAALTARIIGSGCQGHAFEPIVASGPNALVLHYIENSGRCREGDLVLLDFGAERNLYCADCTRTLPVSGRFSLRQREVYDAVYRVFLKARAMMMPGILMSDFHQNVGKIWEEEHISLGLYTREEARSQPEDAPLWKQYFMHGISHSLGLDVHDPFDREEAFRPGMVLTCEPAIYIREEGIGIRLENDILITEEGPRDLTEEIPLKAAEIELLMGKCRKD